MTTTTTEPTTKDLTPDEWAELGRVIARKTADGWGAEWKRHCWDDVWEARDGKWPELDAQRPQLSALWESSDPQDDERYQALKDALYEGWRDELVIRLRIKRDSRFIQDVGLSSEDSRINRPPRHLMLADGTTIAGWLSEKEGKPQFGFRLSRSKEVTISIPGEAEFAIEASKKKGHLTSDRLILRRQDDGYRHWLGRRDVHCGHGITLILPDGTAIGGRYECALRADNNDPIFYFSLAAEYLLEGRAL